MATYGQLDKKLELDAQRYRKLKEAFETQYDVNIDKLYEDLLDNFDAAVDALPDAVTRPGSTT